MLTRVSEHLVILSDGTDCYQRVCAQLTPRGHNNGHTESREHLHSHLHLETRDPPEVTRFKILNGRVPTPRELEELMRKNKECASKPISSRSESAAEIGPWGGS